MILSPAMKLAPILISSLLMGHLVAEGEQPDDLEPTSEMTWSDQVFECAKRHPALLEEGSELSKRLEAYRSANESSPDSPIHGPMGLTKVVDEIAAQIEKEGLDQDESKPMEAVITRSVIAPSPPIDPPKTIEDLWKIEVEAAIAKYPELADENSVLSKRLADYRQKSDHLPESPIWKPGGLLIIADNLSKELAAEKVPAVQKPYTVEEAIADARSGFTGVDPHLQTRARSGDLAAKFEIERRQAHQQIRRQYEAGELDLVESVSRAATANSRFKESMQSAQLYDLAQAQRRLNFEIQRLREEMRRAESLRRQGR